MSAIIVPPTLERGPPASKLFKMRDLICGAQVEEIEDAFSLEYEGKTYYFCSERCRETFHMKVTQERVTFPLTGRGAPS